MAKRLSLMNLLLVSAVLVGCNASTQVPTEPAATPAASTAVVETEPPPEDPGPGLSIEERVEELLAQMTLAEKIGQMTQVEKNSIRNADITDRFIGSILSGGAGRPLRNTPKGWADMVNGYQEHALRTRLGIPLIYGVDAIHGHGNLEGATVFPQQIGLGAANDSELMERIGQVTALEMIATGIYWNFGPVVAVPQDIRWGRTYEGYSENTEIVSALASAYVRGLQNVDGVTDLSAPTTVLATPKHFVGDGGTAWGTSEIYIMQQYMIDQGVTDVDEATLRVIHLPPYAAAIDAGAMSIMVSFSSWGGMKMHAQKYLLTDVLKGEMGFEGFLVSDWQAIDQIPGDYYNDIVTSINAGLDMIMVPYDYEAFIDGLTQAVENGDVPMERIDDAVRRILTAKFQLGLFERPFNDESLLSMVGSDEHREVACEAVRKSLVLLKNKDSVLPLSKETPLIFVAGGSADDVGIQCGGWTIEWQGASGDITPGTTILEAIENTVSADTTVHYDQLGQFEQVKNDDGSQAISDVGIVVVGETPYTEGVGDRADLTLSTDDVAKIARVRETSKKLVVILISGRPMIVTEQMDRLDAFVAAWLPGTEGQGVADVLFGDYPFTGKLPYTWPRSMGQIPFDSDNLETDPLFFFGYGLDTEGE
ncbi:MAG: beta-glucosidase [Chloroflexi bacterium]|nr:beta-glucosidase [Chloroflexota bacterium]